MAMYGFRLWKYDDVDGKAKYLGTDAAIYGNEEDLDERLVYHFGRGAKLFEDTERVVIGSRVVGAIRFCFPGDEPFIKEEIENAGLSFETFEDGFTLPETGRRCVYGGWNSNGDWMVAGNELEEITEQIATLAWEEQLRVESNDNN